MKENIKRSIIALFVIIFLLPTIPANKHILVKSWAGDIQKVEVNLSLQEKEKALNKAIKNIDQANRIAPDRLQKQVDKLGNATVSDIAKNLDKTVDDASIFLKKKYLQVKKSFTIGQITLDEELTEKQNALIELGYAAEISILTKVVDILFLLIIFALMGYLVSEFIKSLLSMLLYPIKVAKSESRIMSMIFGLTNGILDTITLILSYLPFGWILLWFLETVFEATVVNTLALDTLLMKLYVMEELTAWYYETHSFEDSITVPILMVLLWAIITVISATAVLKYIDKKFVDWNIKELCESCNQEIIMT